VLTKLTLKDKNFFIRDRRTYEILDQSNSLHILYRRSLLAHILVLIYIIFYSGQCNVDKHFLLFLKKLPFIFLLISFFTLHMYAAE